MARLRSIFVGSGGIRAGWRLAIFGAVTFGAVIPLAFANLALSQVVPERGGIDPVRLLVDELTVFIALLVAAFVMARIEKRRAGDYGLPLRRGFRAAFWEGAVYGVAGVTLVVGVTCLAGHGTLGAVTIDVGGALAWGALYLVAFLAVALLEEFAFRGYVQYTLATGIGFWPAAALIAVAFGISHGANDGETVFGLIDVVLVSLVLSFTLRRTGDLWLGLGFHMAWDWTETFVFGVPDSGLRSPTHLFAARFDGPDAWTGGTVGPEASWLAPVALLLFALVVHLRYRVRAAAPART